MKPGLTCLKAPRSQNPRGWFLFHSFQPSSFSRRPAVSSWFFGGFLERRIPGKNGKAAGAELLTPKEVTLQKHTLPSWGISITLGHFFGALSFEVGSASPICGLA